MHNSHKEAVNNACISSKTSPTPTNEVIEKRSDYLRAHQNTNTEGRQSPSKATYRCKIIEVENFGNETPQPNLGTKAAFMVNNAPPARYPSAKSNRAKTAVVKNHKMNEKRINMRPLTSKVKSAQQLSKLNDQEPHYTITDYHRELQLASPDKKPITQTSSQLELSNKYNQNRGYVHNSVDVNTLYIEPTKNTTNIMNDLTEGFSKEEIKIAEGHWKDQLLGRE